MWRVHFDERTGVFVLQVLRLGFMWRTVMRTVPGPAGEEAVSLANMFGTYDDAVAHSEAIGLNKLYRDRSRIRFLEAVSPI